MNKEKQLVKNTFIILFGKICTQFISFILLPLYTSVLSTNEYGIVDLIVTYVGLIAPIISLQIEMGLFRKLIDVRNNEKEQVKIITNSYYAVVIQTIIFIVLYMIVLKIFNISYAFYLFGNIIVTIFLNLLLQTARGLGDNVGYSISSTIAGISNILLNILFLLVLDFGIEGMLLSTIIANLLGIIYLFFRSKLHKLFDLNLKDKSQIAELLKYSLPLVPNGLIWWIINVSDRTIVTLFLGTKSNGIYAVSNKFSNILVQIYNVFNLSWTESASLHIDDKDSSTFFSNTFNNIIILFSTICFCMMAFMPIIFPVMVDSNYADAYNYIPLLLIGMMFNIVVSFIGGIYIAKKLTKKVATTSLISGILNIVFNIILINKINIYAAALSTIIAFGTMCIYRYFDVQKYVKLKLNLKKMLILMVCYILIILMYYSGNKYIFLLNMIFSLVLFCYFNKLFIQKTFRKIYGKIKKIKS